MQREKILKWRWLGLVLGEKIWKRWKIGHWKLALYVMENGFWGKKIRISFTFWDSSNCFLEGERARINHLESPVLTVITWIIQIAVAMLGDNRWRTFWCIMKCMSKVGYVFEYFFFWPLSLSFFLLFFFEVLLFTLLLEHNCFTCCVSFSYTTM